MDDGIDAYLSRLIDTPQLVDHDEDRVIYLNSLKAVVDEEHLQLTADELLDLDRGDATRRERGRRSKKHDVDIKEFTIELYNGGKKPEDIRKILIREFAQFKDTKVNNINSWIRRAKRLGTNAEGVLVWSEMTLGRPTELPEKLVEFVRPILERTSRQGGRITRNRVLYVTLMLKLQSITHTALSASWSSCFTPGTRMCIAL